MVDQPLIVIVDDAPARLALQALVRSVAEDQILPYSHTALHDKNNSGATP
jgi:hypothetical protein